MPYNKFITTQGEVLLDLTSDTVTADQLASGITAHDKSGNVITGTGSGGGIDTSDATASAGDILSGKTAYVDGEKVTGDFTINSELSTQDDLIAQIQSTVDSLPEASGDPVLQDKTVTPSASSQNITADSGYDGLNIVTVVGDANLVASNIKSGTSIFGVIGTYEGSGGGGGTSVETCEIYVMWGESTDGRSVIYTTLENGSMVSKVGINLGGPVSPFICVCNTPVIVFRNDSFALDAVSLSVGSPFYSNPSAGLYAFNADSSNAWIVFDYVPE